MKNAILFLTLCAAVATAQTPSEKKPVPKAAAKTAQRSATPSAAPAKQEPPVAQALVIPKEAVARPNGTYTYTDKSGQRWIYSNTFFGISRMQDMSEPNAPAAPKQVAIFDKFTEDGDVIHFEKQTPFGPLKWDRKRAELSDDERQAIANAKPAEKQ